MLPLGAAGFGLWWWQAHQPELAAAACTRVLKAIGGWHTSNETSIAASAHQEHTPSVLTKPRPCEQCYRWLLGDHLVAFLWRIPNGIKRQDRRRRPNTARSGLNLQQQADSCPNGKRKHRGLVHHRSKVALCTCRACRAKSSRV